MGHEYITREGDLAAVNTVTDLNSLGGATPNLITVPNGKSKIDRIIAAFGADFAALGPGAIVLRLTGNGLVDGQQDITVGAAGGELITGAGAHGDTLMLYDANIEVRGNKDIQVSAMNVGETLGATAVSVTLGFL